MKRWTVEEWHTLWMLIAAAFIVGAIAAWASGCAEAHHEELPMQTELAKRVVSAGNQAWAEAGLSFAEDTICELDEFRVIVPDAEWFARACPTTWACGGWLWRYVPVAYVSPELESVTLIEHAAHHEYMHFLGHCHGRPSWGGWWDRWHTDTGVWEQFGPDTAEARGERLLDGD